MTVEVNDTVERYTISGVGPYAFSFRIFADTDLAVTACSTATPPIPQPLTYLTHYTVSGANDEDGGSVTLTSGAAATYAGYILDIRSNTAQEQPTSVRNQGRFLPEIHEDAFDRLCRQVQDLNRRMDTSVHLPDNEILSGEVESAEVRKGRYLFWDTVTGAISSALSLTGTVLTQLIFNAYYALTDDRKRTAAEIAAGVTPVNYMYEPGDARRYGAVGDGTTVNDTFFANALLIGIPIYVSAGTYLLNSAKTLLAGQVIHGDGMGKTIIKFKNTGATLAGFSIAASNILLRDLEIQVDVNGQTYCTAATLSGTVDNLTFDRVSFKGISTKLNNWGLFLSGCTLTGLFMRRCRFELLDLPVFKNNSDATAQRRTVFTECYATNCTDVFEINSPSGSWTDVTVANCVFDSIVQFSVGLANVQRFTVSGCHFTNCDAEGIHVEDGSAEGKITGNDFMNCCRTTNGSVGAVAIISAGAGSRSSHNIIVTANNFDLTQNTNGVPQGVTVQAGGGGAAPYKIDISHNTFDCELLTIPAWSGVTAYVKGNLVSSGGTNYCCILAHTNQVPPNATYWTVIVNQAAVLASGVYGLEISGNRFDNPNSASQIPAFMDLSNSLVRGDGNLFYNPAGLVRVDDNSFGALSDSYIDGLLTNWDFLVGNTNGTTSICFDGFAVHRAFTSDVAATPNAMFPAGALFDVTVGLRFVQNGTTATFIETIKLDWDGTTLTAATPQRSSSASATAPTAAQWTHSAGVIRAASTGGSTLVGQVVATVKGPYFPS